MSNGQFVWDKNKQMSNKRKHGVSFEEASSVFDDEYALYFDDEAHSQDEDRFIIIGMSKFERLLLVCHCYKQDDAVIRIISARKATQAETKQYGGAYNA